MLELGKVLIIGDSYSTFENCIPNGNAFWYYDGVDNNRTDVIKKEQTWWWQLLQETSSSLVLNESFSGATVCNTERPEIPHTSFVYRLQNLCKRGFFKETKVDTVFVFGGTNDAWINSPLGAEEYEDFSEENLKSVFPAFSYLIKTLKETAPTAKIISILNCDINPQIIDIFEKICNRYEVNCIRLESISKQSGHPNCAGMTQIKDQIIKALS